ncbi:sensor histidine kinase [Aquihabitans sp. McL0605]|uniref:sensor histidine kinase n=1 Tax=Aquihabitans sp. McL0605 TaxID=3415671 RepID=UPI003CF49197
MNTRRTELIVLLLGGVLTIVATACSGASLRDGLELIGLAVLGAGVIAVAGSLVGHRLRARPLAVQVSLIAITAVLATLAGALLAAKAMFVSTHDLRVLLVVIAAGATAALLAALMLAERLGRASAEVQHLSERLALDEHASVATPLPTELAEVAEQLTDTWGRLNAARERERAMEASRRELVAWVSHDLRTPLSGIRAMVEALEDGVVDDPATVTRYLSTIRHEADRLAQLVDDLFELSRIQAGALELELERVGLADLVSDAIAATGVAADARGVQLSGTLNDPAPEVAASVPDLARVIRNLLDNAIRHTPRGGAVRVEASTQGDHAVLSVHDSCGGIPVDEIDRVFDLAFRGDAARTPGTGGGGFGLAIARGLVEAHRGDIAVANENGGCRFTVRLPLEP